MVMSAATIPANVGQWMGGSPDIINASANITGGNNPSPQGGPFYNIALPGTTTGFRTLMMFIGVGNSTVNEDADNNYFVGFQEIIPVFGEGERNMNITLRRMAGENTVMSFTDYGKSSVVANFTKINLTTTDSAQSVGQAHMEASLTYTYANDSGLSKNYKWFLESGQQTSQAILPVPNT
ncbi:MAG: hypothetical protein ISS93_02275, partial [Candidatus Aenigmarchaeota archaeon]|nr:hypothetical protein [Candidatus Aenigmarchaeota archaeon]